MSDQPEVPAGLPAWAQELIDARRRKAAVRELFEERRACGLAARHARKEAQS